MAVSNDSNIVFSHSDPLGSSKKHFSAKFENIGAQHVKIVAVGAMTAVDLRASEYIERPHPSDMMLLCIMLEP